MKAQRLVIAGGVRTPFARMGTDLSAMNAADLGHAAIQALLTRTGFDPGRIDEVIFGCVGQPVDAMNVSRVMALRAGIPDRVPAITVHRNCASGCEAVTQAWEKLMAGRGEVFLVGGTESMSNYPLLYSRSAMKKFGRLAKAKTVMQRLTALTAFRPSDFKPVIGLKLGLSDAACGLNMGETAELIARERGVTRDMQDAFAVESHQRALAARERLAAEIAPVYVSPDYKAVMTEDNGPRTDAAMEKLAKLKPVFEPRTGTVTAGNASQVTDGAVALLVMSEACAEREGIEPLGRLTAFRYAGCDPSRMGLGPAYAMAALARETGLTPDRADLVEINEAFAAQVLAVLSCLGDPEFNRAELRLEKPLGDIPRDKLNVNGGAIALGHPVGATGARLILTSLMELRRRKQKHALVSLCVGGGQGAALWLEGM